MTTRETTNDHEKIAAAHRREAATLLIHYFELAVGYTLNDIARHELDEVVSHVVDAAIHRIRAEGEREGE
jgi:cystathionine beta-lyase family protein involved in aluminum resistance